MGLSERSPSSVDDELLQALIEDSQQLRQRLAQFNIYDRDNIVKRAEAKIKDRLRKCIAVATKAKNKYVLNYQHCCSVLDNAGLKERDKEQKCQRRG